MNDYMLLKMSVSPSWFTGITDWFCTKTTRVAGINITVAVIQSWANVPAEVPLVALAALTALAGILVLARHTFTIGLRSGEELGFARNRDAIAYAFSMKGYDLKLLGTAIFSFGAAVWLGLFERPPPGTAILALASAWLAGCAANLTRRWPVVRGNGH